MADITGASLGPIYERLNGAPGYHPLEADTFADWSLEAGDIVTVSRDGKNYTSPVHESTLTWKKGQQMSLSSTGREKRESISRMSQKKYSRGSAGLRNSNYQHLYAIDQYTQMVSGLVLTGSMAKLYVDNAYAQMTAGLDLTSSTAKLYVDNAYAQMQAGLDLTSSTAKLYVDNAYAQMTAGLDLTSSTAKLYVDNAYAQMTAGLDLTSSTAKLYVDNAYAQMTAGLNLTSSTAKLYVDNAYAQMTAGLDLTSSTAKLYVDNAYSQMQSGLALTSSSAILYAQNRTTRAYIMTRINASGEGEALVEADKVKISGNTTINDALTIITGAIATKVPMICSGNLNIISGNVLNLYTATFHGGYVPITLDTTTLANCIKSASVSGDTLTLTPFIGDPITFKKAAPTHTPTATLPASASSEPPSEQFDLLGTISVGEKTNNWFTQSANCEGGSSKLYKLNVDATDAYNKGRDSVTHSPSIDSVWTSSSTPSGGTELKSLKTQYENAKDDGDFFCVRVDCNGTKKTYYCEP